MQNVCALHFYLFLGCFLSLSRRNELLLLYFQSAVNSNGSEHVLQSIDDLSSDLHKLRQHVEGNDLLEVNEIHAIGSLLPDDEEELLAGLMDDFDLSGLPSQVEELDEYDLFGSGGGMELENDLPENLNLGMSKVCIHDSVGNGAMVFGLPSGAGSVAGEHPYGEHPSRTLFVRNINSNVEDSELRALFEVIEEGKSSL